MVLSKNRLESEAQRMFKRRIRWVLERIVEDLDCGDVEEISKGTAYLRRLVPFAYVWDRKRWKAYQSYANALEYAMKRTD